MDYEIKINEYTDDNDIFGFSIYIEKDGEDIGFLKAKYWKRNKELIVENIETVKDYIRQGLGKLRLKEMLKLLDGRSYQVEEVVADRVGFYIHTKEIAENFFGKFGFKPTNGRNWIVSSEELREKLEID